MIVTKRGVESGAWRGEVANVCLDVIARSGATKQSILSFARHDGLLRFARNDDHRATFSVVIAREGGRSSIPRRQ
jgi:hypothetical protein